MGWGRRQFIIEAFSLAAATAIWVPSMHLAFGRHDADVLARALAERQLRVWEDPQLHQEVIARMRLSNAEWDFMGRTFFVLSLANLALADASSKERYLAVIDRILEDTLQIEKELGFGHFMLPSSYGLRSTFINKRGRSIFVDGEIALMLGARRMVQEHWQWRQAMRERIGHVDSLMQGGPVLCGESYPDECWLFCNTAALAALRMSDALDSTDHTSFFAQWRTMAQQGLTDPETGLLVSSFSHDGRTFDGPEGSSIWVAATFLQLVDPSWAQDQYIRAKQHLAERFLGFGYGREWPRSWEGHADIDSGPIVPFVEAAAGSSGAAIVGARAFGDESFLEALIDSLDLAAFPSWEGDALHYAASNGVGDALMLFGLSFGPLWKAVQRRMA